MSLSTKFNPKDQTHVMWLKTLSSVLDTTKIQDPIAQEKAMRKLDLKKLLEDNPMGVRITNDDMLSFPMTHFGLAMIYSNAVLNGEAWIPKNDS